MTQVKINDPWFENIYTTEFNANPMEFISKFKTLLIQERRKEQKTIALLQKYKNSELSLGNIAEKLNTDKEELLSLMKKYDFYLVDEDYDLSQDEKTINKYLAK
ncbi:MAG: hypothetical protein KGV43_01385 [Arcobacter sp.]|nr:hypothetical protein [Arcobacter sp.]